MRFLKRNFVHEDLTYLEKVRYDHFKLDVFYQIDRYIYDKRDLVQEPTLTGIRCMKRHLLEFQEHQKISITFDSFGINFYERFVKHLTYDAFLLRRTKLVRGLKVNTVVKIIKNLKSFLGDLKFKIKLLSTY